MKGIVYQIEIGNYKQIGSTTDYSRRKWEHKSTLKRNVHKNMFLQNVYNKYNSFEMRILYQFETLEEAREKEQDLLNELFGKPYYTMLNPLANGGSKKGHNKGYKHSQETIDKIKKSNTEMVRSNQKSIECIEDNVIIEGLNRTCRHYGICQANLCRHLQGKYSYVTDKGGRVLHFRYV
jgi:hypothetical protein